MYKLVYIVFSIAITVPSVATEYDYFPGLRRVKPSQSTSSQWVSNDARETPQLMKTINELIEERARQRFLEHWQRLQLNRNILQREEVAGPSFTYHPSSLNSQHQSNAIEFAVGPNDPRFYNPSIDNTYIKTSFEDGYTSGQELMHTNLNIILPPSPQDIKPKLPINVNQHLLGYNIRNEEERSNANHLTQHVSGVLQSPVEMGGAITMYIVALIGGISAAVTVGLISIIIGWYTLHKRAKAAVDVEYPAYGVTGPYQKSSPGSDGRLAESAQIYHYQHQKQQIIALEHRSSIKTNVNHTDDESEDDNEEGDYTVYECPGLAPTGEMEIKNPLFLEDTTLPLGKSTD